VLKTKADDSSSRVMSPKVWFVVCIFACALPAGWAHGAVSGAKQTARPASASAPAAPIQPYFVSLKGDKVFMRDSPREDSPVKWIYHRKGLPVEVLASYEVWRRVQDLDGEIGWIHQALLSRERTAVVTGKDDAPIRKGYSADAAQVAAAKPGAIGRLIACKADACEVKFNGLTGWLERSRLWGVHDGENF
jgi:SH3-like domain-containing protein